MKLGLTFGCIALVVLAAASGQAATVDPSPSVVLSGHTLPALQQATRAEVMRKAGVESPADVAPTSLTVVLKRSDPAGFERLLLDVYDPASPRFRKFLTAQQIADTFGPSQSDFDIVRAYFAQHGFSIVEESANRMTLIVAASRATIENTLLVSIDDYTIGDRTFFANGSDPQLPAEVAARIQAIIGLSDLARPQPLAIWSWLKEQPCKEQGDTDGYIQQNIRGDALAACLAAVNTCSPKQQLNAAELAATLKVCDKFRPTPRPQAASQRASPQGLPPGAPPWKSVTGAGQKVGLVQFDTFVPSDVRDYLALFGMPDTVFANLSQVHVNGGATLGAGQTEVLLDIDTVLLAVPDAQVVVYDAPFAGGGSFQALFNRAISDGMTVISNSWTYCEDQTTLADVQSIDAVLATAAAAGISVFNASGDTGSTCLDGRPNTIGVPAGSPHATAVGGTSLTTGPTATYLSETWWNGVAATPPTGQGGYGVSRFFARPTYQNGFTGSATRSIPDIALSADPAHGVTLCQASLGPCPLPLFFGGTSIAAPAIAAAAAAVNQAVGHNLGNYNLSLYPLANTTAFHTAASMGSDFAHVGLGSPNLNKLYLALTNQTVGPVSAVESTIQIVSGIVAADGVSSTAVVVRLHDANGNAISGKTVTLTRNVGSSAQITPASAVTTVANGAAIFTLTNLVAETVTLTATDTTDAIVLPTTTLPFGVPPAASASISAGPASVLNDGIATTTITVTLKDGLGRAAPGKLVTLAQGSGHSVVNGPNPSVTNAGGTIQFTATDTTSEIVTYTAVDVSDGDLPVPGSAIVNFNGQPSSPCFTLVSTAAPGFTLTPFTTGFTSGSLFFGNVNWGCRGASNPGWTADGSAYVNNFLDGGVFKFPAQGGVASNSAKLSTLGPSLFGPVTGKDGKLYAARGATNGNFFTGAVFEIDATSGAAVRTVIGGLTCPTALVVDPVSGDLFFGDSCTGAGSDNPALFRISNPGSTTATLSVYATLPTTPTSWITIAPNGTIYMAQSIQGPPGAPVLAISGTDKPFPPTMTPVPNLNTIYWVGMGEALPSGAAKSLIVLQGSTIRLADITTDPPTYTDLILNGAGSGTIGPDGCLYVSSVDTVYKLAPAAGGCGFAPSNAGPLLALSPLVVTPNPAQGTTKTFTASVRNIAAPVGTQVTFQVTGANLQTKIAATDASGNATFSYRGNFAGTDAITASTSVGTVSLTSGTATVTWGAGAHATFLNIEPSPGTASTARAAALSATLNDVSVNPIVPVVGATIHFALGAQSCNAITNASGVAACTLTPAVAGNFTLVASYAGSGGFLASSTSQPFAVIQAISSVAPSPLTLDFGNQLPNTTSAPRAIVLTNAGTAPSTISSIVVSGTNAGDFAVGTGSGACVVAGSIPANGGTCTLYLTFTPPVAGARSATVTITDSVAGIAVPVPLLGAGTSPLALVSVASRKTHGTAGVMDLTLSANPLSPSTEPRTGGTGHAHTLVFKFDQPVTGGNAAVSEGTATLGAPTFSGNEMTVPLTGVTNAQYVSVTVSNVTPAGGGGVGGGSARLGFLFGDVNQSRQVLVSDVGLVNSSLLQPVTSANFLRDVNIDGKILVSDVGLTNSVLLTKLPAP